MGRCTLSSTGSPCGPRRSRSRPDAASKNRELAFTSQASWSGRYVLQRSVAQGLVDLAGQPEPVKNDSQSPRDANDCALPGVAGTTIVEPPAAQVTVGTEGTEDVMRTADQQPAQVRGGPDTAVSLPRREAEIRSNLTAPSKACGILQGQELSIRPDGGRSPRRTCARVGLLKLGGVSELVDQADRRG